MIWIGYGLSVSPKGPSTGSLVPKMAMLGDRGTFRSWGLVQGGPWILPSEGTNGVLRRPSQCQESKLWESKTGPSLLSGFLYCNVVSPSHRCSPHDVNHQDVTFRNQDANLQPNGPSPKLASCLQSCEPNKPHSLLHYQPQVFVISTEKWANTHFEPKQKE